MSVRVRIPTPLRRFTGGAEEVGVGGATIATAIEDLEGKFPGIKERLCDEQGRVRRFVNIYVNGDDIRFLSSLETPVKDGDEVSIVPAIAGGWSSVTAAAPSHPLPVAALRDRCERAASILDLVGNTPLVEIQHVRAGLSPQVRIFAKLEGFNPGGSVKDRPAVWMVRDGLRTGKLCPGKTIIDSTSGNTGIALALAGAVLGYPVELVMPENVSRERKQIVRAYGAKIVFSSPLEGSDGAIRLCRKLLEENRERYFKPDQYFNPVNPLAHYESTGPEIWADTAGTVTHFVAGLGTGGTVMGTGRYLKERNPDIQVVGVEPDDAWHGLEGLKHMASSIVPGIYHEERLDRKISASTEAAYETVYRLGNEEGLVVGQSSGAALAGALDIAREIDSGVIVAIFPDFGDRYLSTSLWAGWRDFQERRRAQQANETKITADYAD